jgi:hypothetical protein
VKIEKGPQEVLRALFFGTPEEVEEAMEFQREAFRAKFGCYPEDGKVVEVDHETQ